MALAQRLDVEEGEHAFALIQLERRDFACVSILAWIVEGSGLKIVEQSCLTITHVV